MAETEKILKRLKYIVEAMFKNGEKYVKRSKIGKKI